MLIIFDLDDTLIDTSGCITPIKLEDALNRMIEAGLPVHDFSSALDQIKRIDSASESSKNTISEFLEIHEGDQKFLDIAVKEIYENISFDLPIFTFDGVPETLKELRDFHTLALVTAGKPQQQLWKLKKTGIDTGIFSKIVVCEDGTKEVHYKAVAQELGFSRANVVVCGDRISRDLTPAKNLGFRTIHLRKGRGRNAQGLYSDVDYTIAEFHEIPQMLMNFSNT